MGETDREGYPCDFEANPTPVKQTGTGRASAHNAGLVKSLFTYGEILGEKTAL